MKRVAAVLQIVVITAIVQVVMFTQTVHDHREMKRKRSIWGGYYL